MCLEETAVSVSVEVGTFKYDGCRSVCALADLLVDCWGGLALGLTIEQMWLTYRQISVLINEFI